MTAYLTAKEAIGGDPAQLNEMADRLTAAAGRSDELATALRRAADTTDPAWHGQAGTAYRTHAAAQVGAMGKLSSPLLNAASAYQALSGELDAAQRKADNAMLKSVQLGMDSGDLVGRPLRVAEFALQHPEHAVTVADLINEVVTARSNADTARDHFVTGMAAMQTDVASAADNNSRGPDGTWGQRQRNDKLWRRPEGGDKRDLGRGFDFSSDWAGRAILDRYLSGGGDWTIVDDKDWSKYMMDNQVLRQDLTGPSNTHAQQALQNYLGGKGPNGSFDQRFHAEIQNGEGVVGYEYLHGTDASKGDFRYQGTTNVRPLPNGTYEVTTHGGYTWNDTIDPNPKYSTDRWKSKVAEVLTLGQASPYDLHVTWHAETKTVLDKNGKVISVHGYPGS